MNCTSHPARIMAAALLASTSAAGLHAQSSMRVASWPPNRVHKVRDTLDSRRHESARPVSPARQGTVSLRESLRRADVLASEHSAADGYARTIEALATDDVVLLLDGAPIAQGRTVAPRLFNAQPVLDRGPVSWEPFRVLTSSDGTLGVTFGSIVVPTDMRLPIIARYITVWRGRRGADWRIAAHAAIGLVNAKAVALPGNAPRVVPIAPLADAFARTDLAFSRMAGDSGAPTAFGRFAAPDAMTFAPTGELNVGPAGIRDRLAEGRAAAGRWTWHPVLTIAAPSGDLGATIGEAEIRLDTSGTANVVYSKYLTVWQRQPDGTLRFVVDGGSARPRSP